MNIADYLQSLRATKNLTLRQVEHSTGISNSYLSQLESGKILKPSAHVLWQLADLLNGDFEHMLHLTGAISKGQYKQVRKVYFEDLTTEEEELLRGFLKLIRSDRGILLQPPPNI